MKYFNVSIHDVTASSLDLVKRISEMLFEFGIEKMTYLVVPKYHNKENIIDYGDKIRKIIGNNEIAMHGYTHKGIKDWIFSYKRLLTDGEGEFVSFSDLRIRINMGIEIMRKAEIKPSGFIPPAWLIKSKDIKLFKDSDFKFLNTRHYIYNLKNGEKHFSPVLTFSSRGLLQKLSILAYKPYSNLAMIYKILRIAIHPRDIDCPQKTKLLQEFIIKLKRTREETYFSEFIDSETAN